MYVDSLGTPNDLLALYKNGRREFHYWELMGATFQECRLPEIELKSSNCIYANFQHSNLEHAQLQKANFQNASFRGAILISANLQGANLQGADLHEATLRYANLRNADLREADLLGADLRGADLRGVKPKHIKSANLEGANTEATIWDVSPSINDRKKSSQFQIINGTKIEISTKNAIQQRIGKKQRREQAKFRNCLLEVYENRCVITGCGAKEALEAAHIKPYELLKKDKKTAFSPSNGLLLRADLHTLFDLNLISIDPDSMLVSFDENLIYHEPYKTLQAKKKQLKLPLKETIEKKTYTWQRDRLKEYLVWRRDEYKKYL